MTGYRRGPLCGASNPSFQPTAGPWGVNDPSDQSKPLFIAKGSTPVGLVRAPLPATSPEPFAFGRSSTQYTGSPYILGKPPVLNSLISGFVAAAHKTYKNRDEIVKALAGVVNAELKKLRIPPPDTPNEIPKMGSSAGGFDASVWEIKLLRVPVDLTPSKTPDLFAHQCNTIAHEYEHCVDTYMALRFALARGDSDAYIKENIVSPSRIIQHGKANPLTRNSPDFPQAEEMYWFHFFTHKVDPHGKWTNEYNDLLTRSAGNSMEVQRLRRYNKGDAELDVTLLDRVLTKEERDAKIRQLEREDLVLKQRAEAARKRYLSLPLETVGHTVGEMVEKRILEALPAKAAPTQPKQAA